MPGKKMMGYQKGGGVPEAEPTKAGKGKINPKRKKFLEEMEAGNKKVGDDIKARDKKAKAKAAMNNTSDPKAKTPAQAAMGAAPAGGMAGKLAGGVGSMGAMMKPNMPKMKAGGKVKTKGYAKGGKVRGAGIAKKGVRKCKMR